MNRYRNIAIAAISAALLLSSAAFADVLFKTFVPGQSLATTPLGAADYVPIIQGGATTKMPGSAFLTQTDSQTVTNKTISDTSNSITIHVGSLVGTLPPANGGLGLATCPSGSINFWNTATSLACSAALTANLPVIGGGAGVAPSVGSVTGNTAKFVTNTGTNTSGHGGSWDANGNWIDNPNAPFTNLAQTWTVAQALGASTGTTAAQSATGTQLATLDFVKGQYEPPATLGWLAGANPNGGYLIVSAQQAYTLRALVGRLASAGDAGMTLSVYKAASGTACPGSGTVLHSGSISLNGTANADQSLSLTQTTLNVGESVCVGVSGGTPVNSAGALSLYMTPK